MFLSILWSELPVNFGEVHNISIDYADSSLMGTLVNNKFSKEITLLNFKEYGIVLDNRLGRGYDVHTNYTSLIIHFKNK
jgi:hypothetical protein